MLFQSLVNVLGSSLESNVLWTFQLVQKDGDMSFQTTLVLCFVENLWASIVDTIFILRNLIERAKAKVFKVDCCFMGFHKP